MKKIVILHVFTDEKFFDGVSAFFNSLNNVTNLYYYYTRDKNVSFKYIKGKDKIKLISLFSDYQKILSSPQIDIIFFQSLPTSFYHYFRYINPKAIVIWWCFGFEIYNSQRFLPPLVKVDLFKRLTLEFRRNYIKRNSLKDYFRPIYWMLSFPIDYWWRRKILKRIDYFTPVLPVEYTLMKKNAFFKAKLFMIHGGLGLQPNVKFSYFETAQNILIGNSLSYTNNHLDIFYKIKFYKLKNQKYIIPINYGTDYCGNRELFKKLSGLSLDNTIWVEDFLSLEDYKTLISTASHAIFGHMRQQAMGNINLCLLSGVKVFLYKDSILYRQLKDYGYTVFSIEEDLTEQALQIPLSREDAYKNYTIKLQLSADKIVNTENELAQIINLHHDSKF